MRTYGEKAYGKKRKGVRRRGSAALSHSLAHGRLLDDQDPWLIEGSALAVDLSAYDLVFTRGTPPRTEGCRTAGRGLKAVTHDLIRKLAELITVTQVVSVCRARFSAATAISHDGAVRRCRTRRHPWVAG